MADEMRTHAWKYCGVEQSLSLRQGSVPYLSGGKIAVTDAELIAVAHGAQHMKQVGSENRVDFFQQPAVCHRAQREDEAASQHAPRSEAPLPADCHLGYIYLTVFLKSQ